MYSGVSKVTARGQVTLPQKLREEEGIKEGSEVVFFKTPQGIVLLTSNELDSLFRVFSDKAKQLGFTREMLEKEVKALRRGA